jgi:hypothetical protein
MEMGAAEQPQIPSTGSGQALRLRLLGMRLRKASFRMTVSLYFSQSLIQSGFLVILYFRESPIFSHFVFQRSN